MAAFRGQLRRDMGVLPESLGLFDDLTVMEHLDLSARIYGLTHQERIVRSDYFLDALDLQPARQTLVRNCSHGMRKKTALALALLHNPRILFLDEPFEGVDPVAAGNIRAILEQMAQSGTSILITAHTFSLLEGLVRDLAVLHKGVVAYRWDNDSAPSKIEEIFFSVTSCSDYPALPWLASAHS